MGGPPAGLKTEQSSKVVGGAVWDGEGVKSTVTATVGVKRASDQPISRETSGMKLYARSGERRAKTEDGVCPFSSGGFESTFLNFVFPAQPCVVSR